MVNGFKLINREETKDIGKDRGRERDGNMKIDKKAGR